MHNFVMII